MFCCCSICIKNVVVVLKNQITVIKGQKLKIELNLYIKDNIYTEGWLKKKV